MIELLLLLKTRDCLLCIKGRFTNVLRIKLCHLLSRIGRKNHHEVLIDFRPTERSPLHKVQPEVPEMCLEVGKKSRAGSGRRQRRTESNVQCTNPIILPNCDIPANYDWPIW